MNNRAVPYITFVIPAKDEEKEIGKTIYDIKNHNWRVPIEIIVVDNGSTDTTVATAIKAGAIVLVEPDVNIGEARNFGANGGTGKLLAFIDADVSIEPEWFDEIYPTINKLENNQNLVTGSFCSVPKDSGWIERYWFESLLKVKESDGVVNYLGTAHLIMTRAQFSGVGGFDPKLKTGEDYDICQRVIEAGGVIVNNPKLKVTHRDYPNGIKAFIVRESWHGLGDLSSFSSAVKSKVVIAAMLFLFFHVSILMSLVFFSAVVSILGFFLLFGFLVFSSAVRFKGMGLKVIAINTMIFYAYYAGRAASIIIGTSALVTKKAAK